MKKNIKNTLLAVWDNKWALFVCAFVGFFAIAGAVAIKVSSESNIYSKNAVVRIADNGCITCQFDGEHYSAFPSTTKVVEGEAVIIYYDDNGTPDTTIDDTVVSVKPTGCIVNTDFFIKDGEIF